LPEQWAFSKSVEEAGNPYLRREVGDVSDDEE
jgi:hypothetical protein